MDNRRRMWWDSALRGEINSFLKDLNIITLYDKDYIVIDKNCPRIYRIPKNILARIKNKSDPPLALMKDYYNLRRWGYLPDNRKIKKYNNQIPPVLSLRVCEDCNLSCRYCYNKNNMLNIKRLKYMSKQTAQKSLDYFLSQFKNKEVTIVFYGGEPLLNFSTIKRTLNYANEIKDRSIKFKIVSNGTIMNRDILHTIIENDINVMVSLDFPPSEHNRNRPFKNGKHSFEKIKANVFLLAKSIPPSNLMVKSVISEDSDLNLNQICRSFFKSGISTENFVFQGEFGGYTLRQRKLMRIKRKKIEAQKKSIIKIQRLCLLSNRPLKLYKKEMIGTFLSIIINGREPLSECVAVNNAICVNPLGDMYFCDVVANKDEFYLGNIKTGIDETRLGAIIKKYLSRPEECFSCWAFSFCSKFCPLSRSDKKAQKLNCTDRRGDFIHELKFFLSSDYNQIQSLTKYAISDTDDKDYIQNQLVNLKVSLEIYKMLNRVNKYIKPVNILPY